MTHRSRTLLWLVLVLLTVQTPLLFLAAQKNTHTLSADTVAYLRIAQYYSEGRFDLAVSGYWGPLFSWLSMPFYGNRTDVNDITVFLNSGADALFINSNDPMVKQLQNHPCFERIDPFLRQQLALDQVWPIWIYRVSCH